MGRLFTSYVGLNMPSPIIVGSCELTANIDSIKQIAQAGAGAIVLKSLFEEQVPPNVLSLPMLRAEVSHSQLSAQQQTTAQYLDLIFEAKVAVDIPIIASIHCYQITEWVRLAQLIEEAGADAIELNVGVIPFDEELSSHENEHQYFEIIGKVREQVSIPLILKMSHYSSGLAKLIKRISWSGDVQGLVLFNRYFTPDIDLDTMQITAGSLYSHPDDYTLPLRWIALLSEKVECDLVAATGIHSTESAIKMLLAGASSVQIVSALYNHGIDHIKIINHGIENWMARMGYNSIDEFKGKMAQLNVEHRSFERSQFLAHYHKA